jgi:hypothetical protein
MVGAMANARRKPKGGRVTPKGTTSRPSGSSRGPEPSGRYTPPIPREVKVSPTWVPVLMFTLLGLGLVVIFCNYLGLVPGDTSNVWLIVGLVLILGGIITATQYH